VWRRGEFDDLLLDDFLAIFDALYLSRLVIGARSVEDRNEHKASYRDQEHQETDGQHNQDQPVNVLDIANEPPDTAMFDIEMVEFGGNIYRDRRA